MRHFRALWARLRGMFGGELADRELSAELESHLQMHMDDNVRSGMSPDQARRDALIKLGGVEQARQIVGQGTKTGAHRSRDRIGCRAHLDPLIGQLAFWGKDD